MKKNLLEQSMAEIDNPEAPVSAPRTTRLSDHSESRVARRDRGHSGQQNGHRQNGPARIVQFLRDVRAEMRRVSWPTVTNVKNTTIITLIAVVFFSVYLFAIDQGLSRLILGLDWLIEKIARFVGIA
jgi:preprotein translocase subunit SecE